ncbi:Ig-like domain-containing protein [uncultured Methanosphaera sp.]|uniref:Ig-like domain-containing protein n=1 Tax=uncultured Methanosphaera sp. TaxID=262501 RepID=UPI0028053DF6|nr:Ig-like domain-containing protein [uncultured Methanosphaera sp.]
MKDTSYANIHLNKIATTTDVKTIIDENTLKITVNPVDENNNTVKSGKICVKIEGKTLQNLKITGKTTVNFTIPKSWNNREIKVLAIYGENNNHKESRMEIKTKLVLPNTKTTKKDNTINNYYVSDQSGSDINTGSQSSPFKTIQKAINTVNTNKQSANIYLDGNFKGLGNTNLTVPGDLHINFIGVGNSSIDGEVNYTMGGDGYYWGSGKIWEPYEGTGNWGMNITHGNGLITISNFTIKNTWNPGPSSITGYNTSAVNNYGNLEVNNVTFYYNFGGVGASLRNQNGATLKVTNSLFEANRKSSSTGNTGVGVYNNGTCIIINSTFQKNYARWGSVTNDNNLTVINSIFRDNIGYDGASTYKAGTGIAINTGRHNFADVYDVFNIQTVIDGCTFINNDQADIHFDESTLNITNSKFSKLTGIFSMHKEKSYVYNNKTFNVINIVNNTFESPIPSTITVSLSTGSSKYMLYLYGPYTYHIENNTGSKLSCQAIESNMNDSVIKNNTFDDSLIILGNNNIICDNKITTKQMYAINISDTSKNNNITNNYLKSSLFEGDGAVPYTSSINTVINNTPKSSLILINNENFYKYFNDDGELRLEYTDIEKVSLIDTLNNKDIIINQDLTITQQSTNIVSCNITITTRPNTVVEITGLKVKNTNNRPIVILNSDNNIITKSNFTTNNTNTVVINNTKLNNISNNYLIADILVGDESVTSVNENMITSNTPLYQNCIISDETYNQYFNNDGTIKTLDDREIYILIGDLNNKTLILNNNRTIQITNYHTIVPHNITIKTENNTKINMQNITIENTNNKAILEIRSQDNTIENTNLISNNNIILVENATNFKLSANNLKTNCTNSVKTIIIRNSTVLIIDNNITTIGCANENIENTTIAIDSYDSKLHIEHNNILTSYSTINGVNNIIYSINMINPEGSLKTNEITRNTIITTGSNKAYSINYVNQKGYISYSNIRTNAKSNIALNIISSTITGSINYMRILSSTSNSTGIVIDSCENIVLDRNMINLVGENVKGIIVVNVSNINITDSNITLEGTNSVAINLMNVNQSELSSNKIISRTTSDVTPILLNNTNENYITANSVSSTSTYSIKTVNTTNSIIYLNQLYASTLGDESIEIQNINNIKIIENTPEQSFKNLILTDKTYNNFFDENGHLRDEVPYGVSIELRGVIYNKILNITRPINIIGTYMSGFKNTTIFIDAKAKNTNITNMNLEGYENTKLIVNANNCNINIPLVNVENIIEDTTLITINGNYNNITIENITSKNTNTNPVNLIAIHIKGYKNNINITEIKLQNYTKSSGIILSNSNNNEIELNKITSTNHILLNNSNNNYVKFIELNNDATHQCIALHLVNSSNNIISADQIKFTTPVDGNKAVLVENNSNYNKFFKINLGAYTYLNIPISILNSSYNLITGGNLVCKGKIYPMEIIDGIENSVKNNKISSDIISANKAVYQESTIYETVDNPVYENMNGTSIIPVIIQLNVSSEVKIHETITIQVRITVGAITKGNVTFYINGEAIGTSKIVSKRASINYTVTGQEGDKLYIEAIVIDEANKNVPTKYLRFINPTIIKLDSNIILPNVVSENGKTTFTALIRDEEGNIQTTGKVAFKLNGKTYGVVNIENGIAQLTVDSSKLSAKNYTITAVYGGNTMTEKSTQNATLTITKSTPKIQMPTTTKRTNNTQITINLTDENGNKINSNQKVCIKFNGCTIINTKAENGTVKVNLDLTQYRNSQYDFTVVCGENSLYNTSRLTSTLIIE